MKIRLLAFLYVIILAGCGGSGNGSQDDSADPTSGAPPLLSYTVLNAYPHDTSAFTQGMELYRGKLYESTGLFGKSTLRVCDLKTGQVLQRKELEASYFAEGITILRDTLYQLTWQNHEVLVYRAGDLALVRKMPWTSEGWGITHDSSNLFISDGSDKIYVVRPYDLKLQRVISVSDHAGPVNNLNELEYIDGRIWANRWQYDHIVEIDPSSGMVLGKLDLADLLQRNSRADLSYMNVQGSAAQQNGAVLNGIAWDASAKRMLVTGKLWPNIFELSISR